MERTMTVNVKRVNYDNAKEHMEDTVMRKAKNFLKIGLEVIKEVRHNWAEAERRY